jgi:Mor family transcriptional regulator
VSKRKASRSKAPEYLADFMFICTHTLIAAGIEEAKAVKLAQEMAERQCKNWGKQLIYWPEYDSQERLVRNARIFQECNGTNFDELAKKYDLSIQAVYSIFKAVRAEEIAKRQTLLFAD